MQARLAPQRPEEAQAVANAGLSTKRIYELRELVARESLFVASVVTGGTLLRGPWQQAGQIHTDSIVIAAARDDGCEASVRSEAATGGGKQASNTGGP